MKIYVFHQNLLPGCMAPQEYPLSNKVGVTKAGISDSWHVRKFIIFENMMTPVRFSYNIHIHLPVPPPPPCHF